MIYGIMTKEQAVTIMEEGRTVWACSYELDPRTGRISRMDRRMDKRTYRAKKRRI